MKKIKKHKPKTLRESSTLSAKAQNIMPFFSAGFTLLETIVAVAVLITALVGPMALSSKSIRSAALSKSKITAAYLASEAMEYVKNKRDSNFLASRDWLTGLSNCAGADGCYIDAVQDSISPCSGPCPKIKYYDYEYSPGYWTGLYTYVLGNDTIFRRTVKLSSVSASEEKIEITVSWEESFGNYSVKLEERIFKWQ